MIVSGGTGSGKTTLLGVLSGFIPENERIVTIEDAAELQLRQAHVVTLEARTANIEGTGAVTIRDLVRNALRMRPDRIIVGEVRSGETLDMLGISALVIDIGTLNIEKSKLQNALDASALAGAQSLPDQSGALSSARSYFTANGYDSADLTVTFPDSETVRCASSAEVQTTFARVLGISSTSTHELHATAIKTKRSVKSPFDYAVFQGEPGKLLDMMLRP